MEYEMLYATQIDQFFSDLHSEMAARLIIQLSTEELIRLIKKFEGNYQVNIHNCHQDVWQKYWDLVTTGEWRVIDSAWTDRCGWHDRDKPLFIDVDAHREWMACKTNQDRDEYWKNHKGSKSDVSQYNMICDILVPGYYVSESYRISHNKNGISENCLDKSGRLVEDCIGFEIKVERNYNYSSDSNMAGMGRVVDQHSLYILQPTCKSKKERMEIIAEIFRDRICSLVAQDKMNDYFKRLVPTLAEKILNEK
jgi:hypothetical protein